MLPTCPDPLPADIEKILLRLASLWATHTDRPRIDHGILAHWDDLIESWIADEKVPLLIRKKEKGIARGEIIVHDSGRLLIWTDNSPASWSYFHAYAGKRPTMSDIRRALEADEIPVSMVVEREMKARSRCKCCLSSGLNPNKLGWKVCHVRGLRLHGSGSLRRRDLADLQSHFRNLMSPSNMFLVPKSVGGLGELPQFIEAMTRSLVETEVEV